MSTQTDTAGAPSEDLQKRLSFSLLICRLVTVIVFGAYAYGTIVRPEMNADAMGKVYYIKGLPSGLMVALGVAQLAITIAVLVGAYKKITRGILLVLAALAVIMPTYVVGYFTSTIGGVPHPAILYWTSFCLFACVFMIYRLREHDTLLSLNIGDK